jgi:hypothetical protein
VAEFDSLQAELAEFSEDPFRFVSSSASPASLRVVRSFTLLDKFDRHADVHCQYRTLVLVKREHYGS